MNGWNRIFLVLSVLWAMGLPIFVMVDTNNSANRQFSFCADTWYNISRDKGETPDLSAIMARCNSEAERMSPAKLLGLFFEPDGYVLWLMVLTPIALLWIVGSIIVGTIRWIARGFSGRSVQP